MNLAKAFASPIASKCGMGRVLASLEHSPSDREALTAVMDDRRWTIVAILAVLRAESFDVSYHQVKSHRAKECACFRTTKAGSDL